MAAALAVTLPPTVVIPIISIFGDCRAMMIAIASSKPVSTSIKIFVDNFSQLRLAALIKENSRIQCTFAASFFSSNH